VKEYGGRDEKSKGAICRDAVMIRMAAGFASPVARVVHVIRADFDTFWLCCSRLLQSPKQVVAIYPQRLCRTVIAVDVFGLRQKAFCRREIGIASDSFNSAATYVRHCVEMQVRVFIGYAYLKPVTDVTVKGLTSRSTPYIDQTKKRWWNCVQTDINKRTITNWKEREKNRANWEKSIKETKVRIGL